MVKNNTVLVNIINKKSIPKFNSQYLTLTSSAMKVETIAGITPTHGKIKLQPIDESVFSGTMSLSANVRHILAITRKAPKIEN